MENPLTKSFKGIVASEKQLREVAQRKKKIASEINTLIKSNYIIK